MLLNDLVERIRTQHIECQINKNFEVILDEKKKIILF